MPGLARDFSIVTVGQRGCGPSGKPVRSVVISGCGHYLGVEVKGG